MKHVLSLIDSDQHASVSTRTLPFNKLVSLTAQHWYCRNHHGDFESLGIEWRGPNLDFLSQELDPDSECHYQNKDWDTWMCYSNAIIAHWNAQGYQLQHLEFKDDEILATPTNSHPDQYQYSRQLRQIMTFTKRQ